jgi:hypothetical protein
MNATPLAIHVETVMLVHVTGEPWIIFVDKRRVARRFPSRTEAIFALCEHDSGRVPFEFVEEAST